MNLTGILPLTIFREMKMKALKYLTAYILPASAVVSFTSEGWLTFLPLIIAFGLIPGLELLIRPDNSNISEMEEELRKKDRLYDWVIYLVMPLQWLMLLWYLLSIDQVAFLSVSWWGRTIGMGLLCGVMGINVAHELGHRRTAFEKFLAKGLLLTSLYTHFYIEHNYGHHKNVATPEDPASARKGESLYAFWLRSIVYSYLEAWQIEIRRLQRKKRHFISPANEMLRFTLLQILLILTVYLIFGLQVMIGFLLAAFIGMLLLETVNYIEHYGLHREKVNDRRYERTTPVHSWNSNHVIGRLFLFELSRHSDHHAWPHKPYQLLNSYDDSPQMPTGYPGMMLLSAVPPLWFAVMHPLINKKPRELRGQVSH